jgi:hypothetical protein
MTLQDAQNAFTNIINSIVAGMTAAELDAKTDALLELQQSLPDGMEFDVISTSIREIMPKLEGKVTVAVLEGLQANRATMVEASDLLREVGAKANAEARTLTFEKPKLVLIALNEAASKLKEIRDAAKIQDLQQVGVKTDALITLVENTLQSIKAA